MFTELFGRLATLPAALPGAVAQGLVCGIMAIGVFITYRILDIADLTVDGSFCTGGAVCIIMMLAGHNVWFSMLAATLAGFLTGLMTGIFHTFMLSPLRSGTQQLSAWCTFKISIQDSWLSFQFLPLLIFALKRNLLLFTRYQLAVLSSPSFWP